MHRRWKVVPSEAQNFSGKKTVHIPAGGGFTGAVLCERAEVEGGGTGRWGRWGRTGKVSTAEEGGVRRGQKQRGEGGGKKKDWRKWKCGGGVRDRRGAKIRFSKKRRQKGGNLRLESCILQSELLQAVGFADCVENLVHHLWPLEGNRSTQEARSHLTWNKNPGRENIKQAVIRLSTSK